MSPEQRARFAEKMRKLRERGREKGRPDGRFLPPGASRRRGVSSV
ncbi:MAG TPA: hypothetical protein VKF62_08020 [Planctomycetota bacterium]|nr:hypothetical protein [Planctomycetota bacterium]